MTENELAKIVTYLPLTNLKLGLLINFHQTLIKMGSKGW